MDKKWYAQKTTWTAILMIVSAGMPLFNLFGVALTPEQAQGIQTVFIGLAMIFLRQGVEDIKKTVLNQSGGPNIVVKNDGLNKEG